MILEIVSPEAKLFSGEVVSISLPGVDGEFQILNNHAPIVSLLKKGTLRFVAPAVDANDISSNFQKIGDAIFALPLSSGTVEMKDNKVIVLAE